MLDVTKYKYIGGGGYVRIDEMEQLELTTEREGVWETTYLDPSAFPSLFKFVKQNLFAAEELA